ncbi:hypothetical protein BaRGS_00011776 [Batillaria attramentaria]|uniref:Transmembrane protein n=1 Tax=Batillaria attramentaria TaxID=370345 RepID=A0ABD0LCE0_9CAEN
MPCCVTIRTCLQDELEDFLPKINMEPRVSDEDRCDAICTQIVHWFGLRCMPLLFHVLAWCLVVPKLVIGGLYLHDCPVEPKLPIYLIVSAFIPVALYLCCCGGVYCEGKMVVCIIVAVPILFMLAWLGAGTAFYVGAKQTTDTCQQSAAVNMTEESTTMETTSQHVNTTSLLYDDINAACLTCDDTLLVFTLVTIIIEWIANGLFCLVWPCAVVASFSVDEY